MKNRIIRIFPNELNWTYNFDIRHAHEILFFNLKILLQKWKMAIYLMKQ